MFGDIVYRIYFCIFLWEFVFFLYCGWLILKFVNDLLDLKSVERVIYLFKLIYVGVFLVLKGF